ncbi:hypothetical protein NLM27_42290 [Bradyrhizobium sp. CCGB12]|uniref:hypothetical protein n=1 Tax=Bradyrhizobium sp. CCGB12 TaxID=2949632 RepID=UPI0020B2B53F|nr:hypothetical protein [Bradyrhizobium sp. CCGB12]MCP3395358.1 hypothetical protein [Bradyrhizobium sp. CCGB12]
MPVYRPSPIDHEQAEQMREIAEKARQLLRQAAPDTFLGRKTCEPPPKLDHQE